MVRLIIRAKLISEEEITEPVELKAQWRPVPLIIAGALLLAIVAAGVYFFVGGHDTHREVAAASNELPLEAERAAAAPAVTPDAAPAVESPSPRPPPSPLPSASTSPRPPTSPLPSASTSPRPPPSPLPSSSTSPRPPSSPLPSSSTSRPPPRPPPSQAAPLSPPTAIDKVLPVVPPSASETIRGTIRVTVQVVVGEDGKVVTATTEDPGPSRYFERLSLNTAKKWTFSPGTREMHVKFSYTRSGVTADASPTR